MSHSCHIPNLVGYCIDHGRLKLTRILGSGSSGVIFLAQTTTTPTTEYAVKCIIRAARGTRRYSLQRQEILYHHRLSAHSNIVTLHKVIHDSHYIFLVMDYCRGGDLFSLISQRSTHRGHDECVRHLFLQMLDAVEACHQAGVFHRDLKPENFLVNEDGSRLFLTDFGLATENIHSSAYGAGSPLYMSPECIGLEGLRQPYNTRLNDIWALGVILTSLISGHNPWGNATPSDACYHAYLINNHFLREMLPISSSANSLLQRIFRRESARSITVAQIRAAVQTIDTFFMRPEEIARGNNYLRSAAKVYFRGSERELHFVGRLSLIASGADRGSIRTYEEESHSTTLESIGPLTPQLYAQGSQALDDHLAITHDIDLSQPMYARAVNKLATKCPCSVSGSSGLLQHFIGHFGPQ